MRPKSITILEKINGEGYVCMFGPDCAIMVFARKIEELPAMIREEMRDQSFPFSRALIAVEFQNHNGYSRLISTRNYEQYKFWKAWFAR
jgi:hypothetical protein